MLHREDNTQKKYAYIKDSLSRLYKKYGYEQITIPMFMEYDEYKKFNISRKNEELKLIDGTGSVLTIRPDATYHVLNSVASLKSIECEKYFYEAKVFRNTHAEYIQNEINQAGVECFLKESNLVDSDIIALAINSLISLGIKDIRVDLSHADFVYALIEEIDEIKKDEVEKVHKFIEEKDRDDLTSFLESKNVKQKYIDKLIDICMLFGDVDEVIKKAREIAINDKMIKALDKIEGVYELLKVYGLDQYIYLDLGFTNSMNYYSGIMFKIYSIDAGGEITSGGRYDRLAKKIARRAGACGFSQNLDVIADIIEDDNDKFFSVDYIAYVDEKDVSAGLEKVNKLRAQGYNVSLMAGKAFKVVDRKTKKTLKDKELTKALGE